MAVDYVKTGQAAHLSRELKPPKWPHFMEKVGKQQRQIYTSRKVLGQLYDQVERIDFVPAFTAPFDKRILQAYTLDASILESAREIKEEYDAHMRRIMAQQEIKTEFEVWSTFVLQHSSTSNAFKYHEQIGEISIALKDQFRLVCHERAGGKDYKHIGPFAAAMYEVTAREVTAAVEECHQFQMIGGQSQPVREMKPSAMPLMSFPWLFQDVLGKIAKSNSPGSVYTLSTGEEIDLKASAQHNAVSTLQSKRVRLDPGTLDSNDYLKTSEGKTHPGEILELFGDSTKLSECKDQAEEIPSSSISVRSSNSSMGTSAERGSSAIDGLRGNSSSSSPELLARKSYEACSHNVERIEKGNSTPTTRPSSHMRGSKGSLQSQERTEVAEEKTIALDEPVLELYSDDSALNVKPEHQVPEGSNLRLLGDMMGVLPHHSDEPGALSLNPYQTKGECALEDTSIFQEQTARLLKSNVSNEEEIKAEMEQVIKEDKKYNKIIKEDNSSGDSDIESDEIVPQIDGKARLLDQLIMITGDSTLEAWERK